MFYHVNPVRTERCHGEVTFYARIPPFSATRSLQYESNLSSLLTHKTVQRVKVTSCLSVAMHNNLIKIPEKKKSWSQMSHESAHT